VILRQCLDAITNPGLAVREHVGSQSAPVHEAMQKPPAALVVVAFVSVKLFAASWAG
jgi:hypothetical protein